MELIFINQAILIFMLPDDPCSSANQNVTVCSVYRVTMASKTIEGFLIASIIFIVFISNIVVYTTLIHIYFSYKLLAEHCWTMPQCLLSLHNEPSEMHKNRQSLLKIGNTRPVEKEHSCSSCFSSCNGNKRRAQNQNTLSFSPYQVSPIYVFS